jgi:hypothetical protein
VDSYFEYLCESCQSSTTWRLLGYELPMTFELLNAPPQPEREPRKLVSDEQRRMNLEALAAYDPSDTRRGEAGPKAPKSPPAGRRRVLVEPRRRPLTSTSSSTSSSRVNG